MAYHNHETPITDGTENKKKKIQLKFPRCYYIGLDKRWVQNELSMFCPYRDLSDSFGKLPSYVI